MRYILIFVSILLLLTSCSYQKENEYISLKHSNEPLPPKKFEKLIKQTNAN